MNPKLVRIFIASTNDLNEERLACVDEIGWLNESHEHLYLRGVRWEYTTEIHSYYNIEDLQELINPKLEESDSAVFIFYSRLGYYTKAEFDLATKLKKTNFLFFKQGYAPPDNASREVYEQLVAFKEKLPGTTPYHSYSQLAEFRLQLYKSLNQFLSKKFPSSRDAVEVFEKGGESQQATHELLDLLSTKENQLKQLEAEQKDVSPTETIQELRAEVTRIQKNLLKQEEVLRRQKKSINNLKRQLDFNKAKGNQKEKSLEELDKKNFSKAEQYLLEWLGQHPAPRASDFYELGTLKIIQLKYNEALSYFELAVQFDQQNSWFLYEAGSLASTMGFYDKAIGYLSRSSSELLRQQMADTEPLSTLYNELGIAYRRKADYTTSLKYFKKAFDIEIKKYGEDDPAIATLYNNIGLCYDGLGDYREAIRHFEKALEIDKRFFGEESRKIATRYNNLGSTYDILRQTEKAIDYYTKALAIDNRIKPEPDVATATLLNNLGLAYFNIEDYDLNIEYCRRAIDIYRAVYGDSHPDLAAAYNNVANGFSATGESQLALDYFTKAIKIDSVFHAGPHPETAVHYMNRAKEYKILGDIAACKADFKRAEENLQLLPKTHTYWHYFTMMYIKYFPGD